MKIPKGKTVWIKGKPYRKEIPDDLVTDALKKDLEKKSKKPSGDKPEDKPGPGKPK